MARKSQDESPLEQILLETLTAYKRSFQGHKPTIENVESDVLMEVFDISPEMKTENRQFWGRELGMCWQRIISSTFAHHCPDQFSPPRRYGGDEPYDVGLGAYAIDTKYRVGSGDAGTLKKFKQYGAMLQEEGLKPVQLILRNDNLPAAITAIHKGGWEVHIGKDAFDWIEDKTNGFRLDEWLRSVKSHYSLDEL
jgi:hypothetical protein